MSACLKYSRRCLNLKSVLKQAALPEADNYFYSLAYFVLVCTLSKRVLHFFYKEKAPRAMPACILETFNCSSIIIIKIINTIVINNIIIKSTITILRCQFVYLKLLIAPPQRNDTEISSAGGCWRRQQ